MISLREYTTIARNYSLQCNLIFEHWKFVKRSGDIWHSSFEQVIRMHFELVYQTAVFFWYLNDFLMA
jgi:hypothetical protein